MDAAALTFLALGLPFAAALIAPALTRFLGGNAAWLLALAPFAIFVHFAGFVPEVAAGEIVTGGYAWIPSFNVSFSWLIDGLSLTFALLISGIGTLIVLYSGGYLKGHPDQGRFFSFILMFMGSMQGLVVSDSFLMLFVFWELTSITSFLLIGFDHRREAARRAALQALVVTGGGGLALLAGLIIIWNVSGVTQFSLLLTFGDELKESPFYLAALLLVLGGAFTKSAQFPFHFWLPNAMEAPTPVSAYLHSATMVKAGVYLLMRLNPVLGGTTEWQVLLPLFGVTTLIAGAALAVRQTDLKMMLAYTTMSSLGLLVMLTGLGLPYAIEAAVLYLVAHALFKGALFMVAGIIDHETGTRDLTKLGGLRTAMPLTFVIALTAALSMGGLPPFFGFLAKEEIYTALSGFDRRSMVFAALTILGNGLMFAVGFAIALKPFLGPKVDTPKPPHEAPVLLWLGPAILAAKGLSMALMSGFVHRYVTSPMASAVAGEPRSATISLVPHFGVALLLSVATLAVGVVLFLNLARLRAAMVAVLADIGWGPDRGFDQFMRGLVRFAVTATRRLQGGPARHLYDHDLRAGRRRHAGVAAALWRIPARAVLSGGRSAPRIRDHGDRSPWPLRRGDGRGSADGDRLPRHSGLCRGDALSALRRPRSCLHPIHDRDTVGRRSGAGDDAVAAVSLGPQAAQTEAARLYNRARLRSRVRSFPPEGHRRAVRFDADGLFQSLFEVDRARCKCSQRHHSRLPRHGYARRNCGGAGCRPVNPFARAAAGGIVETW